MKIAVTGCLHGELDKIYKTIADMESRKSTKVDLVLCCGDFQAVRNPSDFAAMSIPSKYRFMGDFNKYYAGTAKAPILTIVIGGNHEASNYLQELPYGGWLAPNIYYLGYAGVVNFGGLRIAGLSGIYKQHDYTLGHFEHPPYNEQSKRSAYHVRNVDVFRLSQLAQPIDVILSHDWPRGIYHYGNQERLLSRKQHFQQEVEDNTLGSKAAEELLTLLKPRYWFSAHLHVKFAAVVAHDVEGDRLTRFLALDKCLPGRDFLQFLDIEPGQKGEMELSLDPEWLCVLSTTDHLFSLSRAPCMMPGPHTEERWDFSATPQAMQEMMERFGGELALPENFEPTAPAYRPNKISCSIGTETSDGRDDDKMKIYSNPQTELICAMLEITNPNAEFLGKTCTITELQQRLEKVSSSESSSSSSVDSSSSSSEGEEEEDEEEEDEGNETQVGRVEGIKEDSRDDGPSQTQSNAFFQSSSSSESEEEAQSKVPQNTETSELQESEMPSSFQQSSFDCDSYNVSHLSDDTINTTS